MFGSKIQITDTIQKTIDPKEIADVIRTAVSNGAEINDITRISETSFKFIATPSASSRGLSATVDIHTNTPNETTVKIDGKIITTKRFWPAIQIILTLLLIPAAILLIWRTYRSKKLVREYAANLANQISLAA